MHEGTDAREKVKNSRNAVNYVPDKEIPEYLWSPIRFS